MTFTTLGIGVVSNADKAAIDLDRLTASAGRAEVGADRLAAASGRASAATSQMSLNSANIAAQLQDVVVSAQMGMSGLQVGLQQGTQLAAVLNQVRGSGMSIGPALAASFMSIVNPVSLVTIGLIAVSTYALQALGSITDGAATASEAIDDHAEKLGAIVKGYKGAEDAVRDWAKASQTAPREVIGSNLAKAWEDAMREVEQLQRKAGNVSGSLFLLGGIGDEANSAIMTMRQLLALYSTGAKSAEELQIEMTEIANTDFGLMNGNINEMARGLADSADKASALNDLYIALEHSAVAANTSSATQFGLDNYMEGKRSAEAHQLEIDALKAKTPAQERDIAMRRESLKLADEEMTSALREQKIREAGELAFAKATARAGKSATKDFDQWGSATRDFQKRIDQMQVEIDLFGQGTYEIERQKAAIDLLDKAKDAGVTITDEVTASIDRMSEEYATATAEIERLQFQQEQIDALNNTLASGFADLFIGIADGSKTAQEGVADLLKSLGNLLINQAFQTLFAPAGVGGMGFNPFGFLFGGGRATGGPVQAGMAYRINENTPNSEYFVPATSGTVVPAANANASNDNGAPIIHIAIDARGAERGAGPNIAREVRKALPDAIEKYNSNPYRRSQP